jgi:hypothetical protein
VARIRMHSSTAQTKYRDGRTRIAGKPPTAAQTSAQALKHQSNTAEPRPGA